MDHVGRILTRRREGELARPRRRLRRDRNGGETDRLGFHGVRARNRRGGVNRAVALGRIGVLFVGAEAEQLGKEAALGLRPTRRLGVAVADRPGVTRLRQ